MSIDTPDPRKRILVLTSTFPRWADDTGPAFVFDLAKRLGDIFDITVLAPHAPGAKTNEKFGSIETHRFRYFLLRWQKLAYDGGILANLRKYWWALLVIPFFMLAELASTIRLLRTSRVDVIHAHWIVPQGIIAIAARVFTNQRPAIICTSHGSDLLRLSGRFFCWIKRQTITRTEKFIVVSKAMRQHAQTLSERSDIDVIPMGVDLQYLFIPPAQESIRATYDILCVGRLVSGKGISYMIQAMSNILERYPQTRLNIVGDGPERGNLEKLTASLKLNASVNFLGAMSNLTLNKAYQKSTIFVSPSLQEGFGLTSVEAMGCECAVIAADLPAIRDVVIDGVTGLICKQADSEDLAHKVLLLLDSPELRMELGRTGRRHVIKNFDWQVISSRYQQLILELCSERK